MRPSLFGRLAGVFGKTYVERLKHVKVCLHVGNIKVRLLKGPTNVPTRTSKGWSRDCLGSVNRQTKRRPADKKSDRRLCLVNFYLYWEGINKKYMAKDQLTEAKGLPIDRPMTSRLLR